MNTPTNLLVLEVGGGCEVLIDTEMLYESVSTHEHVQSEEVVIISGTITVSP